jgi:hypothetical protein
MFTSPDDPPDSATLHFDPRLVPQPPRLHWGWLVVLQIVTFSFFGAIWLFVQAIWAKRITGRSTVFVVALIHMCLIPAFFVFVVCLSIGLQFSGHGNEITAVMNVLTPLVQLMVAGFYFATAFMLRSQLEDFPINIPLSGIMTFFFGPIYFQYHLHDYAVPEAVDVFGELPASPTYVQATLPKPAL